MATVKSDWITAIESTPPSQPQPGQVRGKVRCAFASITFAAAQIGDNARMLKLPKGAKIVPGGKLVTAALGASVTISVGITGTTAKYLALTACNTADQSTDLKLQATMGVSGGLTAEEEIILTVAGAAATGKADLYVFYVQE